MIKNKQIAKQFDIKTFIASVGIGVFIWLANLSFDYFLFHRETSRDVFLKFFFDHELLHGFIIIGCFLGIGLVFSRIKANQEVVEETLKINEQILQNAQRIAHVGSWHLDINNNHLTWSDEVYRIFGLQPHEFKATYEAFLNTIHPDDRERVNSTYKEALNNKTPYDVVHRIVRPNGEIRIVHEKSEDIRDDSGKPIHSIGMVHDITELKKTEEAKEKLISQLQKALSEVKTLQGIIPICSFCKKIRDDEGYWDQVEVYVQNHTEADFSHGICPECFHKHYPDINRNFPEDKNKN